MHPNIRGHPDPGSKVTHRWRMAEQMMELDRDRAPHREQPQQRWKLSWQQEAKVRRFLLQRRILQQRTPIAPDQQQRVETFAPQRVNPRADHLRRSAAMVMHHQHHRAPVARTRIAQRRRAIMPNRRLEPAARRKQRIGRDVRSDVGMVVRMQPCEQRLVTRKQMLAGRPE